MDPVRVVLYIEDDPGSALLVRKILESEGMTVIVAPDGISGLEAAREVKPDLVLMDINLPNLEGEDTAIRLKSEPELAGVPVVALTAYGGSKNKVRFLSLGCEGFISKPIEPDSFPSLVMDYMEGRRKDELEPGEALEELRQFTFGMAARLEARVKELVDANRELEKANSLKSRFIDKVTHELSSPLTPILGYSRILEQEQAGPLTDLQRKCVKALKSSAARLKRLVDSLLEVSYLESGRFIARKDALEPETIFEEALKELAETIYEKEIDVEMDLEKGLLVLGDLEKLISAFGHILHNAVKFSPKAGVILCASCMLDKHALLCVSDQGPGIPERHIDKVFQDFYQVPMKSVTDKNGAGLGLAIARRIVEAHGGSIRAESPPRTKLAKPTEHGGTCILVELPVP